MLLPPILFAVGAYIVGSVPFGKLIAARVARIDITRRGSGNIGATNVARELGMKWGVVTLVLDILKGLIPMMAFFLCCARGADTGDEIGIASIGVCALLGHMFPVFLKFQGGKGVATALGVFLGLSPLSCLFSLVLFVAVVAKWRFVSLGSLVASSAIPVFLLVFGKPAPYVAASVLVAVLIWFKHRANIVRLLRGEEPKWKQKAGQPSRSISLSNSSSE